MNYQQELEEKWQELDLIIEKYPNIFPDHKEKYKCDFLWSYEFVLNKRIISDSGSYFICPLLEMVQLTKYSNSKFVVRTICYIIYSLNLVYE